MAPARHPLVAGCRAPREAGVKKKQAAFSHFPKRWKASDIFYLLQARSAALLWLLRTRLLEEKKKQKTHMAASSALRARSTEPGVGALTPSAKWGRAWGGAATPSAKCGDAGGAFADVLKRGPPPQTKALPPRPDPVAS